jgi:hypothetical protein
LAKQLQRRRYLEINQSETRMPVAAMFINESGLNEQALLMTSQGCLLPSFESFGKAVSEKKIF